MSTSNALVLNRIFNRSTYQSLIAGKQENSYLAAIERYVIDPEKKNNRELISDIYRVLENDYRNEYYYKNTLLNKLLLGVHKPTTTSALTELPVGRSKADFVLINGKAVVYEIKTELDNLSRLRSQIGDYFKAFTYVTVVTCESNSNTLKMMFEDSPVGIYILTKDGKINRLKEPQEFCENLDLQVMFKTLRKSEYESVLMNSFGYLPNASQFNYYRSCKEIFCKIEKRNAHILFKEQLKKRTQINIKLYSEVPYELKFLTYFSGFKDSDYEKLSGFLTSSIGG